MNKIKNGRTFMIENIETLEGCSIQVDGLTTGKIYSVLLLDQDGHVVNRSEVSEGFINNNIEKGYFVPIDKEGDVE